MSAQNHINLLGKKVRDRVTGFAGIVTSVAFDLPGCIMATVTPAEMDKDGKPQDGRWLDVNRLEITDDERVMPVPKFEKEPPKFGKTPATHSHGPVEKPARKM